MTGFIIKSQDNQVLRFSLYQEEAPVTSKAFYESLPFTREFFHARVSGQEIWTGDSPEFNIIQENASIFAEPGEIVLGPMKPARVRTANCIGIYYGDGKGLDSCNIFGKVFSEDMTLLKELGESIWKHGSQKLTFDFLI